MFDKNEIKKDLYKSKVMAKFSHYVSGNIYYTVELSSGEIYQFPIPTLKIAGQNGIGAPMQYFLSDDLGTTTFTLEMKGSELNRWISKAIDSGEFIKVG